jgi:hypothetical protein
MSACFHCPFFAWLLVFPFGLIKDAVSLSIIGLDSTEIYHIRTSCTTDSDQRRILLTTVMKFRMTSQELLFTEL